MTSRSAMKFAKPEHLAASRALACFLTLGPDGDRAEGLARILTNRLSEDERVALTYAALTSLDERRAYQIASLACFGVSRGEVAA